MKRILHIRPGYNCGKGGAKCEHEKKGDHGICSDVWFYVVSDHTRAVTLEVFSSTYPPMVERATLPDQLRTPWGGPLTFHVAANAGNQCEYVAGGRCSWDVSYLQGRDFWKKHGDPKQPEQGEAFWLALEAKLPE